jgi:hypothetical protein
MPPSEVGDWSWMRDILRQFTGSGREQPDDVVFLYPFFSRSRASNRIYEFRTMDVVTMYIMEGQKRAREGVVTLQIAM